MQKKLRQKMIEKAKEPLQNYLNEVEQAHKKGLFTCSDCPIICCDCVHGERPISETVYFPDGRFFYMDKLFGESFRTCSEFARKYIDENGIIYYEPDPKRLKNHVVVFMDK